MQINKDKILIISNMYPSTDHATYGIFVKRFVDLIQARDIKYDLVVIRGKGKNTFSKLSKYLKFIFEIYSYLLFRNYRYVYIHYLSHTSLIILPIIRIKLINFVSNFHGGDLAPDTKIEQKLLPFALKLAQRSKLIVVPSTYFKKLLRSKTNIQEEKILVSPSSGINISLFKPELTKLDKNDREFHIGYVSRIDTNKGWDDLLQAAKRVKEQLGIKIKLHLVGKGAEMYMLKESINTLDLDGDVIIYGEITHNELPGILHQFDVFVFPTRRMGESLGLVGIEAMACGIPVIASRIGGIEEYLNDGENGFFYDAGNIEQLINLLILYSKLSKEDKIALIESAIITAKRFDENAVMDNLLDHINAIV